ncbi:MAG: hypothetical protein Q9170_002143 [Blastenia crenularia]
MPIVTCFVPNLPHGCPFRVSLHSWLEPEVSRGTQALTTPDDCVFFEARVLLDGAYAGYVSQNMPSFADQGRRPLTRRFQRSSVKQSRSLAPGNRYKDLRNQAASSCIPAPKMTKMAVKNVFNSHYSIKKRSHKTGGAQGKILAGSES